MKFNKGSMFNRLRDVFDESSGRMREVAGQVGERVRQDGRVLARQARHGLSEGRDRFLSAEEAVMRSARDHPLVYILSAVGLAALIGALFVLLRDRDRGEW
jgi:hypothetical protein